VVLILKITGVILVDSACTIVRTADGPFRRTQMLRLTDHLWLEPTATVSMIPVAIKSAHKLHPNGPLHDFYDLFGVLFKLFSPAMIRLLFGAAEDLNDQISTLLPCLMTITAWIDNMNHVETLLNDARHDAIANPSIEAFYPLTLLRRNIAHLEEALIAARTDIRLEQVRALEVLRDARKFDLSQDDSHFDLLGKYDELLGQTRAISTSLNNEIQLVIGSVTVQVCTNLATYAPPTRKLTGTRIQQS
jgi:hypothetical protein